MDRGAVWERQTHKKESPKAYDAFCAYRSLPPRERSLAKAWAIYKDQPSNKAGSPPGHFREWSAKFQWVARAAAYDEHQRELDELAFQEKRLKQREHRQLTIQALEGMLGLVLNNVGNPANKNKLSPKELNILANAATKILDESRKEFNDLPVQRREITGRDGKPVEHNVSGYVGVGSMELSDLTELDEQELDERIAKLSSIHSRMAAAGNAGATDGRESEPPGAQTAGEDTGSEEAGNANP